MPEGYRSGYFAQVGLKHPFRESYARMQPEYGTPAAIIFYITSKTLRLDAAVVVWRRFTAAYELAEVRGRALHQQMLARGCNVVNQEVCEGMYSEISAMLIYAHGEAREPSAMLNNRSFK
ncbi:hypothetical protein C8F04DRAFT_1186724 [Mycena alexandri]|uniref:Uncharacterized protein n=1 Tax=Mycena alexandri TaxID=1745969 RepID=A0AAD6SMK6_9AGAR|nr:hypothetical protein C8F04DRAFT_1186724 [Mycena alexandri]